MSKEIKFEVFDEEYETFEEYVAGIHSGWLEEQGYYDIPFLKLHHEEVLDHYVDFKRGYEEKLIILEEDYKATGRPKPPKKDRKYYGFQMTEYNHGESGEYTDLVPYELKSRRVTRTIKKWEEV